ncbi:MAG: RdgB/HAM1 family non-canonical purine NTP pyrophosphatase [Dehalococcoidia bacterium]
MHQSTIAPDLLLATSNAGKVRELRALLTGSAWRLRTPAELGLTLEPEENGATYADNARLKAEAFAAASGLWALADDSGLEVDALDGAPGVHSARYAGLETPHADKIALLLQAMAASPDQRRTARFRTAFVLAAPDGRIWETEGVWEGAIAEAPRGTAGFGYDPIFLASPGDRTAAELSDEEKDRDSHRALAATTLLSHLRALAPLANAAR